MWSKGADMESMHLSVTTSDHPDRSSRGEDAKTTDDSEDGCSGDDGDGCRRITEYEYTQLFEIAANRIHRYVWTIVRSELIAEEITQEVFLSAWRYQSNYKYAHDIEAMIAWLRTIAKHHAISYLRRRKARCIEVPEEKIPEDTWSDQVPGQCTEDGMDTRLILLQLYDHAKITTAEEELLRLHCVEGYTYAMIAQALDQTEDAIRNRYFRILTRLRKAASELMI